jgi:hypothetical protein
MDRRSEHDRDRDQDVRQHLQDDRGAAQNHRQKLQDEREIRQSDPGLKVEQSTGAWIVLKWWPIVLLLLAGLGGWYGQRQQIAVLEANIIDHKVAQVEDMQDIKAQLTEIRGDVKALLARK